MLDEKSHSKFSVPIDIPRPREVRLIELFEPSSPNRPHHNSDTRRRSWLCDSVVPSCMACNRRFAFLIRRHHCRRCGRIFCGDCSNNRITHLHGPNDLNYYRVCNNCMEELLETQQAVLMQNDRCALSLTMTFRKTAAIAHQVPITANNNVNSVSNDLLSFDDPVTIGSSPSGLSAPGPVSFESTTNVESMRDNVFSRIAAAALSLPARLRPSKSTLQAREFTDTTLETCPVCSLSFRKWDTKRRQIHIDECIKKTETSGSILGDRYSTHRWSEAGALKECSICYEEFMAGQRIAVLNCLCQFHETCIDAWFERGKYCPFHTG